MCVCVCFSSYTREAGVRSLERKIGALCRAVAVKVAEGQKVTEPKHESLDGSAQEARGQSPIYIKLYVANLGMQSEETVYKWCL